MIIEFQLRASKNKINKKIYMFIVVFGHLRNTLCLIIVATHINFA